MVLLPSLVLGAEIESTGVLEVWWENHGLVASLAWKLNAEIPAVEGDEGEVEVLRGQVLVGKRVEAGNGISKSACIADMLPGEGSQAGCFICQYLSSHNSSLFHIPPSQNSVCLFHMCVTYCKVE